MIDNILSLSIYIPSSEHLDEESYRSELTTGAFEKDTLALHYYDAMSVNDPSHRSSPIREDQIASPEEKHQQELVALKLQIAKQQEKIDIVSSKLSHCQELNEALHAENANLIEEVALARNDINESLLPAASATAPRFSLRGQFGKGHHNDRGRQKGNVGGSMQMLVDSNAKLIMDNSRLQVSVGGLRESFLKYIKFSQRCSREDRGTIEALQRENELLRQQSIAALAETENTSMGTPKTSSVSEGATHENQDGDENAPEYSLPDPTKNQDDALVCHDDLENSGDDLVAIQGKNGEGKIHVSEESKVGDTNHLEEHAARKRSEELLVDFGETRRAKPRARRWQSVVW